MDTTPEPPELVAARIAHLDAERAHFDALTRHEQAQAEKAELETEEARYTARMRNAANDRQRTYDFNSQVSQSSINSCLDTLSRWSRVSPEPIRLVFNSPGGSVIEGFRLYDFLLTLRADGIHVTTVVLGMAASMAGILLQGGDRRVSGPNAHMLIHEVSASTGGKIGDIEDDTKFYRSLNDRLFAILAQRSTMSKGAIAARAKRRDWWLSAEETVKRGFADAIGYR